MTVPRSRSSWNQLPPESVDEDDTNSSLVFGNDQVEETQKDDKSKENGSFSLQNSQSPSKLGLSLHYDDTQIIRNDNQSSPLTFKHPDTLDISSPKTDTQYQVPNYNNGAENTQKDLTQKLQLNDDTQVVVPNDSQKRRMGDTQLDRDNSPQASQAYQSWNDTQRIGRISSGDTQRVPRIPSEDTQKIPRILSEDTQRIPRFPLEDTQKIPRLPPDDTQRIQIPSDLPRHETQVLQTLPENHDTQVIRPFLPEYSGTQPPTLPSVTLTDTLKAGLEDFQNTLATSSPRIDDIHQSRTQVINTQEVVEERNLAGNTSTKPVVSSSQRSQPDKEEIQSEDEDWTYVHVDDTLELNRLKRHEHLVEPRKRMKNDANISHETIPSSPTVPSRSAGRHLRKMALTDTQSVDGRDTETQKDSSILRSEALNTITQSQIVSRNSVWAAYDFRMYIGLVVESGPLDLSVKFEDDIYKIKNSELHLLDVRIGDKLRVRTSPNEYIVCGLVRKPDFDGICCIRGFNHVLLKKVSKKGAKELLVELEQCSMELPEWIQHQQKFGLVSESSVQTTPRRRTREEMSLASKREHISLSNQPLKRTSDLFRGCLFCLTNIGKGISAQRRLQIRSLVETNGGVLLEDGFETIFSYAKDENGHRLTSSQLDEYYFAAVVSNSYGRSAKYLQALSLGWPIVSDSFIFDCAKGAILISNWPVYLLPAGQSKKTNSVKSIDIYRFRNKYERGLKLVHQLDNNGHLLTGYHILFIDNKTNNKNWDTCEFIFHAFGAKSLRYVKSKSDLENHLDSTQSRYLIYDNSGTFKVQHEGIYGIIDWEWVVQCVISGFTWEPKSFK
ncbi:hypothetical protein QFC19_008232 [Naganishia cerealis]|uniref:Uncharacterized protein n=1 Tax=Naganishia cerealis TaxID=610337 RepID=A0ACC2V3U2_9TREE|nr:hypothetical protein QFC19_008232 [Naganishia cerealis]